MDNNYSCLDHDLFKIINGHPLALVMVSSLRKNMRLKQIYDLLVLIREEWENEKDFNTKNIAINLSMEATLQFLRSADKNAHRSLVYFALMPAGLSSESLCELLGNQWEEYKQLLISKSLIFQRYNVIENNDQVMYKIENNLIKMILKNYSKEELLEWESHIISFVSSKLIEIYKINNKNENYLFISLEGNIWEILNRLKERFEDESNQDASMKNSSINNPSESSWIDSDQENNDIMPFDDVSPTRSIRNGKFMRKSTYHLRKEEVLNNLSSSKRIKLFSSGNFYYYTQ